MKLLDVMIVSSVEQFFIVDKKRETILHFKVGFDDLNDYNQDIFSQEVLNIKVAALSDLGSALTIKIDYEAQS